MKFPFKNPAARAIAAAISAKELACAARAAGITFEDAGFVLDEILFRIETGRSSFKPERGDPLRWGRRSLSFLLRERRKKNHEALSNFDQVSERGEVSNSAIAAFGWEQWLAEERLSALLLNLPDARTIAEREKITRQQANNLIRKFRQKAATMAKSGAPLADLAEFFNADSPELCRTRKPKKPGNGGRK